MFKTLFEDTLKTTVWVKEEGEFYRAMLGDDIYPEKFINYAGAYEKAEKIRMLMLADWAALIVGPGVEYRGVVGRFLNHGN